MSLIVIKQINFLDAVVDVKDAAAKDLNDSSQKDAPSKDLTSAELHVNSLDVYDGLPGMGNESPFELNAEHDPFFFHDDTAETITGNATDRDASEIVPDEVPFYANQEEDPEVQRLMSEDFD